MKAAVLPLIPRDEGMVERARALFEELRRRHTVEYDDSGQIGRRYRRQDEIGTPWAFTIDEQTLEDETVTVRDRDSLAQERLPICGRRRMARRRARPAVALAKVLRPTVFAAVVVAALAGCGGGGDHDGHRHADEDDDAHGHRSTPRPRRRRSRSRRASRSALAGNFALIPGSAGAGRSPTACV